jgi:hypothetical protein
MLMKWTMPVTADLANADVQFAVCSQDSFARKKNILSPARLPFHHSGARVEERQVNSFSNRFQSALALAFATAAASSRAGEMR